MPSPILVFGYGNPGRGDDALGPVLVDELRLLFGADSGIEFLTDFQLQIEHALDLTDRSLVLFADAHVSCAPPFDFQVLVGAEDDSYTTHAMSPAAVLRVFQRLQRAEPPPTFLLSLPGYRFGLGEDLSAAARLHLEEAVCFCRDLLRCRTLAHWQSRVGKTGRLETEGVTRRRDVLRKPLAADLG